MDPRFNLLAESENAIFRYFAMLAESSKASGVVVVRYAVDLRK